MFCIKKPKRFSTRVNTKSYFVSTQYLSRCVLYIHDSFVIDYTIRFRQYKCCTLADKCLWSNQIRVKNIYRIQLEYYTSKTNF